MDNSSLFAFMDIIMVAAGVYLLYCWYLLKFKGEVKKGVLLPKETRAKCRDIKAYTKEIGNKLLLFAVMALAAGGVGLYSDYVQPVNTYVYLGLTTVFLVVLIWFVQCAKKAEKKYFD